jgi:hypothetical protein
MTESINSASNFETEASLIIEAVEALSFLNIPTRLHLLGHLPLLNLRHPTQDMLLVLDSVSRETRAGGVFSEGCISMQLSDERFGGLCAVRIEEETDKDMG